MLPLTKKDLIKAIGSLIDKDPIINIDIDFEEQRLIIQHLSGDEKSVGIAGEEHETPEIDYAAIEATVREYVDKHQPQESEEESDNSAIYEYIDKQLSSLKDTIPSKDDLTVQENHYTEVVENKEEYDDSTIREWVAESIQELSSTVVSLEKKLGEVKEPEVVVEKTEVDYETIFNRIEERVQESLVNNHRSINDIEVVDGKIFLSFDDGTKKDLTQVLLPLLRPKTPPAVQGEPGARGRRGESAYNIAVRHGFQGTEEDWLESIGGEPLIPQDGTIEYNEFGEISKILQGTRTTEFERDSEGTIVRVIKDNYIQEFIRDAEGNIDGWTIIS